MGFKIKIPKIANPVSALTGGVLGGGSGLKLPNGNTWDPGQTTKGILKNPGKELGNFATNWSLGLYGKKPKDFQNPGEDPNVTALRDRLFGEAGQFEQDLPGMQQQASSQIEREGDLAREGGLKGTRQNFNRRGLLYSGLREAGEQDVRGRVASTMANQKAQSNQDLSKMSQAKYAKAAQAGLQGYQDAVNKEAEIAGISLQNQVARAQMMQQLGQTTGQIGGYMYGAYSNDRINNPSQTQSMAMMPATNNSYGNVAYDSNQYRNDWNLNRGPFA